MAKGLAHIFLQAAHAARERSQAAAAVIGGAHDESDGSDFSLEGVADSDDDEAGQDLEQDEDDEEQEEANEAW